MSRRPTAVGVRAIDGVIEGLNPIDSHSLVAVFLFLSPTLMMEGARFPVAIQRTCPNLSQSLYDPGAPLGVQTVLNLHLIILVVSLRLNLALFFLVVI